MRLCDAQTRYGRCLLEEGHKGYHSVVVYECDGCGKLHRGQPHATLPDGEDLYGLRYCFMCSAHQVLKDHGV